MGAFATALALVPRSAGTGGTDPLVHAALEDFIAELPGATMDYRAAVCELALRLYTALGGDQTYFVDKTPLYHLIVDEIFATFPRGRFVFLFRNPLSVVASCVELFDQGRWEVARYHMAVFQSFADLIPASAHHADRSISVRYEDLVEGGDGQWRRLIDYLDLPWEPAMLARFSGVSLRGRMGDPTGVALYRSLSREPLEKWRSTICNPLRRAWCRRYLQWLGPDRLATMGYELDDLQRQLTACEMSGDNTLDDASQMAQSLLREVLKARVPRYTSRASTWRALLRG